MALSEERELSVVKQVYALLVKNFTLKWRYLLGSVFELVLPVAIIGILVAIRTAQPTTYVEQNLGSQYQVEFNQLKMLDEFAVTMSSEDKAIAFAPSKSALVRDLATEFSLTCFGSNNSQAYVMFFDSEADIDSYIRSASYSSGTAKQLKAAIVLDEALEGSIGIVIRMNSTTDIPGPFLDAINPFAQGIDISYGQRYYTKGFLGIQNFVQTFVMTRKSFSETIDQTRIILRPFPAPGYTFDIFASIIKGFLGLFLTISFTWPVTKIIGAIVLEKETRQKELMKIMGVSETALVISWILLYLILFLVQSLLITLTATYGGLFSHSNFFLVFLFFFLFGMSIFAFAAFVSSFFSQAKTAATVGALVFFLTYFVDFAITSTKTASRSLRSLACLIPTVCVSQAASPLFDLESIGVGIQWSNLGIPYDSFPISLAFVFLFVDFWMYLLLSLYINQLFPGDFGVPQKWNFPFSLRYWFPARYEQLAAQQEPLIDDAESVLIQPNFESISSSNRVGIKLMNLTKSFSRPGQPNFIAVNGINLDILENQVFALLGHNGAGKTTTLNMVTGMLPVGLGDIVFGNQSIKKDLDSIRHSLGICPQHDILYDDLTVEEHIILYGRIKGISIHNLQSEIPGWLASIGLEEKRASLSKTLSGGQKRKLHVILSFLPGNKYVVLDEPSSGMDPNSRRNTWEIIKANKQGRTVILTTHFMDEAEALGNRIAIMAAGNLLCCGSSLFLKTLYGIGYLLTISRDSSSSGSDSLLITELIRNHISSAQVVSDASGEISFRLRFDQSSRFAGLFSELESMKSGNSNHCKVKGFSISVTTLEEVFLKAETLVSNSEVTSPELDEEKSLLEDPSNAAESDDEDFSSKIQQRIDKSKFGQHLLALMMKRYHDAKRTKKVLLWQILYPCLIVCLGIVLIKYTIPKSYPATSLSLESQYGSQTSVPFMFPPPQKSFANSIIRDFNAQFIPIEEEGLSTADQFAYFLLNNSQLPSTSYGALGFMSNSEKPEEIVVFFNTSAVRSLPVFYFLYREAYLKNISKVTSVHLSSHAFPLTARELTFNNAIIALLISIAFSFIPASFGGFLVKEKQCKSKHLQFISGVNPLSFWLSNFFWDLMNFLIPTILCLTLLFSFQIHGLVDAPNVYAAIASIILYGLSIIPFTYLLTFFFFTNASSAQNFLLLLYIISGSTLFIAATIMDIIESTRNVSKILKYVYRIFPNYAFAEAIGDLMVRKNIGSGSENGAFGLNITGKALIYMAVEFALYFAILLLFESSLGSSILSRISKLFRGAYTECSMLHDEDIVEEDQQIMDGYRDKDAVVLKRLSKVYGSGKNQKVAVRNLSFSVPRGQCFGKNRFVSLCSTIRFLRREWSWEKLYNQNAHFGHCTYNRNCTAWRI
jgi:ATP-binding cassette subfamily A (ABC1) protein 1